MRSNAQLNGDGPQDQVCGTDIAVIGMACKFPCAEDYDEYWENVISGRDCIREVPSDRWSWQDYFGDPRRELNKTNVKWGGFVADIDKFDPLFFGISPSEAAFIDPQHRIFLEAAWHAIEDAGYSVASLSGRSIGVYAGVSKNDYSELMRESRHEIAAYVSTGTVHSILANRISFLFNLHGISQSIDTACSSSLVALHNAIRDMVSGHCEAAIVGGVNALITPTMFISHAKSGMLSSDGRCRTFSAGANGYVRGEGVGVLFVKPLHKALCDRDHVHAVIKSVAINHGGRSNFLTSPSTEAQAAVIAEALRAGRVDPRSIDYIEAHGTGTLLGDPIEIDALKKAFAQLAPECPFESQTHGRQCGLGSVKTNIGHLESASGMAGIIKVVMAMKRQQIPPIINFSRLNPHINLTNSPFYVATEAVPWVRKGHPRRAGVSSFGMGGVNGHVVLEEAPRVGVDQGVEIEDYAIPLSARKGRLKRYVEALSGYLTRNRVQMRDLAYTLQTGRDVFEERVAFVASSIDELLENMQRFLTDRTPAEQRIFTSEVGGNCVGKPDSLRSGPPTDIITSATQWVQGSRVDWSRPYTSRPASRLPLPTYPFARRRCWFTDAAPGTPPSTHSDSEAKHPSSNTSSNVLRTTDFFIRDHIVQGKNVLPAAVHLELARSPHFGQSGGAGRVQVLRGVYWIAPVVIEAKDTEVQVRLTPVDDGAHFEILQNGVVHSKGSLADHTGDEREPPRFDVDAIHSRCRAAINKRELYAVLRQYGLAYGSSFQVIERCVYNDRELLAEITLPEEVHESLPNYALHPAITDGLFQAVTALSLFGDHHRTRQFVPFYLESARILKGMSGRCLAYATVTDIASGQPPRITFSAWLADCEGNLLVEFTNLQKRPVVQTTEAEPDPEVPRVIRYRPVWRQRELKEETSADRRALTLFANDEETIRGFREYAGMNTIVIVRPGPEYSRIEENVYTIRPAELSDYERLLCELQVEGVSPTHVVYAWDWGLRYERDLQSELDLTIYGVFRLTRAALRARLREGLNLVYLHKVEEKVTHGCHSMVAGFARTLKYENPSFNYVVVGGGDAAVRDLPRITKTELGFAGQSNALREVRYKNGRRYERHIERASDAAARDKRGLAEILKSKGLYIISGGAGGLGFIFSQYLAGKCGGTLIWLGRSAMNPAIAKKITAIEQAGAKCVYFSVDITDCAALKRVVSQIREAYGQINGVIHAAGLIEDAFILKKEPRSFARVVEPKVAGALNLDALTQADPLDFFVLFSSIAALMPNQGQCDYSAANSFLDHLAETRNHLVFCNERSGVTLALNWPLWRQGGIQVTEIEERYLLHVFGMKPMETTDGLELFEQSLALARSEFPTISQVIAVSGEASQIDQCLGVEVYQMPRPPEPVPDSAVAILQTRIKVIFATLLSLPVESIDADRSFGELGVNSSTLISAAKDINDCFHTDIKPTLLFDINNISKLATYLIGILKIGILKADPVPTGNPISQRSHSLIDFEESDAIGYKSRRTFCTSEFFLRDHVVDGQYNVPGACYVEMARQAADLALGEGAARRLLNNYWASPLSSAQENFTAHVQMTPKADHLAYEILSYNSEGERRLHAMGQIARSDVAVQAEKRIDVAGIRSRSRDVRYPREIYAQIWEEGLKVGPTFQPMKRIYLGDSEAVAILELPEAIRETENDYVLHPALLTGAFQAALVQNKYQDGNTRRYIPIGMDELEVTAPIPAECYVYCRPCAINARNEQMRKFDVEICRPDGVVVVSLRGFSIKALKDGPTLNEVPLLERTTELANASVTQSGVHRFLLSKLARSIGLPVEDIDPFTNFEAYGVSSIMVVELNEILADIFGPIPKTLFFEYRNIAELAEYFIDHHSGVLIRTLANTEASATDSPLEGGVAQFEDVCSFLRSLIAGPIGLPADELEVSTGFDQYGVNSVMVVEINELLESSFGPLSKTLLFEYRNIDELGRYFLEHYNEKIPLVTRPKTTSGQGRSARHRELENVSGNDERLLAPTTGSPRDIAIVSAAGRFPGARNLKEFWDVLREGRDCISEIPPDRFDYSRYFDPNPEHNRIYSRWGGFIEDVDKFDPTFFNISPREAELIDPQERLLLEVVWEALEHAGYTPRRLADLSGRKVGVFVGALWQAYESLGVESSCAGNPVGPSSLLYSIANRISYFFDLTGPSMAIDTACSSSLTALHLACQSIRNGESRCAIVGGVNLSLSASKYLFLSRCRFLSTDGRCRSYGAGGNGYVPGEGVCAVLLKPLADAIADGDSILAVIKGGSVTHGGRTNGYTVPDPRAQANVIKEALQKADIDPRRISYIEGHGTGTSLGDPIEIEGLEKALGFSQGGKRVCAIGSVKSNIGHLEAAAGLASVIKVILQMQNGQLAPSLHAEQLNPNITFGSFRVQRELADWPRLSGPRCAGVSSFGAGGSNAHIILEEYGGPVAQPVKDSDSHGRPALCIFSARTEDRLFALASKFVDHLQGQTVGELHAIAYTLQLGREPMRERLAVIANNIDELRTALSDFLQRKGNDSYRRGRVAGSRGERENRDKTFGDLAIWINRLDFVRIAAAWVEGAQVEWMQLYGGRQYAFLALPSYPFAKERCWIDVADVGSVPAKQRKEAPLQLVLHPKASDVGGLRFRISFTGDEFFLRDHFVRTQDGALHKVLPAVVYLEMARLAIERVSPPLIEQSLLELRNIVWLQPILVAEGRHVEVELACNGDEQVAFEIYTENGEERIVHCQGRAARIVQVSTPPINLERLAAQMTHSRVAQSSVYVAWQAIGFYGPSLQAVREILQGHDQLLAQLELPNVIGDTAGDYLLHPSLMDGALQSNIGLIEGWSEGPTRTRLPFALESIRVISPCVTQMEAWVRYSAHSKAGDASIRLDIDLLNKEGRPCVQMRGFTTRALEGKLIGQAAAGSLGDPWPDLLNLAPVWDPVEPEWAGNSCWAGRVIVIGGDEQQHHELGKECVGSELLHINVSPSIEEMADQLRALRTIDHIVWILPRAKVRTDTEALLEEEELGVLFGFRLIKALLAAGYAARDLGWTVLTHETQRLPGETGKKQDPVHGGVHGLIGSMAKEYTHWHVRLADVSGEVWPWAEIARLRPDEQDIGWAFGEGQWYRRRLLECKPKSAEHRPSQFRRGGIYVLIGGAGGLGQVLTQYLATKYQAQIVWVGRSEKDLTIERKLERVATETGVRPLYIAVDARNQHDLEKARQEIKDRYGRINGVIHSAIVLADKSLANMTEIQFRTALSAKVDIAIRLEQVFGPEALDFILYFSSALSFLRTPGQSNYSAGCTFADAFAEWQADELGRRVKVVNWGYWGSVGVVAGADYQERMGRLGLGSIEPASAMVSLEEFLHQPLRQIAIIRATGGHAPRELKVSDGEQLWIAQDDVPPPNERTYKKQSIPIRNSPSHDLIDECEGQRREFDNALAKILCAQIGDWTNGSGSGLSRHYERWMTESLRTLARRGYLQQQDGGWVKTEKGRAQNEESLWKEWEPQKRRWEETGQALSPQIRLAELVLRSLRKILRGDKRATDVMFPNSALDLVESVYKNDPITEYFNTAAAEVVCRYVEQRRQEQGRTQTGMNLRFLELGAGTGATSQAILPKLDAYRGDVKEYCYTDVSKLFLLHGERICGPGRQYLSFAALNVERGLDEQGVELGVYDVVIAANVLHATRRIRDTVRNIKAALKKNGVLVLNELSANSLFLHLTFGLLDGWWLFEDEGLRIEGSPVVKPDSWRRVLGQEGFRSIGFPVQDCHELGQQIVVAASDGKVRKKDANVAVPETIRAPSPIPAAPAAVIANTTDHDLIEKTRDWLAQAVSILMKLKLSDVDPDAELNDLGFDSISLTGLANQVNHAFGLELIPTIFFEHTGLSTFARYLANNHRNRLASKLTPNGSTSRLDSDSHTRLQVIERTQEQLVEAVVAFMKLKRTAVDIDTELRDLGFDSISLTGFANRVNQLFGLDLMPTIFFEHSDLRSLAAHLVDAHRDVLEEKLLADSSARPGIAALQGPIIRTNSQSEEGNRTHEPHPLRPADEAIAIIGMSGRFPGADDLDEFWENLKAGKDSITEIPRGRWDWLTVYGDEKEDGNKSSIKWAAFIDGVDEFDPLFFGISPREAELMDPQQRLLMTYGWKAFEDAGYTTRELSGSRTGIFVGTGSTGYGELVLARARIEGYSETGLVPSVGPNRLSYFLNLHGPSEPIETACSSSLVAIHHALRAIRDSECEMALAGGVNTILTPVRHIGFSKAGMLSPDGKCKTFSNAANGFVRGEGVGMVVLKRLSAAERDGDHIYGLVRGSAENHGGRANSLTAPNPQAQAQVIVDAFRRARVNPRSVSYIEAHGTGTALGDPVEINGLKTAFHVLCGEAGEQLNSPYCGLGSVKTNIGHLEFAAGIAGVIKVLLQMKHRMLVPTLHCDELNPYIRLEQSPFYVVRDSRPWERLKDVEGIDSPLRAGVSSFGFGGVNAHVLLEEYVGSQQSDHESGTQAGPSVILLSAKSLARLKEQAIQLRDAIGRQGLTDGHLPAIAYTLQVGRDAMDHRLAMLAVSIKDLDANLQAFIEDKTPTDGLHCGEVKRNSETMRLFREDEEMQDAVEKWIRRGKWSRLLQLWAAGLDVDFNTLYTGIKPRRMSLPTYPFAKERYWVGPVSGELTVSSETAPVLHPLLHRSSSGLNARRYTTTFTGKEFFLADHAVRRNGCAPENILPGVAYLEMARAAIEDSSPIEAKSRTLELRNTAWLRPLVVFEQTEISIAVFPNEKDGEIEFEIYTGEAAQKAILCHGEAAFVARSERTPIDLSALKAQMDQGALQPCDLYTDFARMGLIYGPRHRGIRAIHLGGNKLLAALSLPKSVVPHSDYVLHPSLMDSALQASLCLTIDFDRIPENPPSPFVLESVRILSGCTTEMAVWVRHSPVRHGEKAVRLDLDLCDSHGNICVQIRRLASRILEETEHRPLSTHQRRDTADDVAFDSSHYSKVIADLMSGEISVEEAVALG